MFCISLVELDLQISSLSLLAKRRTPALQTCMATLHCSTQPQILKQIHDHTMLSIERHAVLTDTQAAQALANICAKTRGFGKAAESLTSGGSAEAAAACQKEQASDDGAACTAQLRLCRWLGVFCALCAFCVLCDLGGMRSLGNLCEDRQDLMLKIQTCDHFVRWLSAPTVRLHEQQHILMASKSCVAALPLQTRQPRPQQPQSSWLLPHENHRIIMFEFWFQMLSLVCPTLGVCNYTPRVSATSQRGH